MTNEIDISASQAKSFQAAANAATVASGPENSPPVIRRGLPQYKIDNQLFSSVERLKNISLKEVFDEDPDRVQNFSLEAAGLYLDYSKNHGDLQLAEELHQLADEAGLKQAITSMYSGEKINTTEDRAALHVALRDLKGECVSIPEVTEQVNSALDKMFTFASKIRSGNSLGFNDKPITDVVVLGIGGSYLGPKLVCEALKDYSDKKIKIHFVSSIDPAEMLDVLDSVSSESTLFMISSKTFSTLETIENAKSARHWLLQNGCPQDQLDKHFISATSNDIKAREFGISDDNIFPLWDWVGGRYSLWSSVGLPILIAVGKENFLQLLGGAHQMDRHFQNAPIFENMPVIMALLGVWHINYQEASTHAVLPYSYRMRSLTEHLQQLDMESNGKGVDRDGWVVSYATGPVVLGGMGNNGQHAYYQLLHQGPERVPVDFILSLQPDKSLNGNHHHLLANGIAHGQALMVGQSFSASRDKLLTKNYSPERAEELAPHLISHGNQPSNTLVMERLTPASLGALLALYEHKIYCQGVIWNTSSFDQWGVELGKELGGKVFNELSGGAKNTNLDSSTQSLIDLCGKSK